MKSNDYPDFISKSFAKTIKAHEDSKFLSSRIATTADLIIKSFEKGGKVVIMGNGGSASDASHMASELVGRFKQNRIPLPAIALTTDTSLITAVSNDFGYDQVFVRQCLALAKPGDIAVAISTSGKSANVIKAVLACKKIGSITTVGLTGNSGDLISLVDISLAVPSDNTATIQDVHRTIIHAICEIIDDHYAKK